MKSKINGLIGFFCLGFVGITVIGLAIQLGAGSANKAPFREEKSQSDMAE